MLKIFALILSLMVTYPVLAAVDLPAEVISEEEVNRLIDEITVASNARDVAAIRSFLWDDAHFVLINEGQTLNFTVAEYMDVLKDTWGQTKAYTYNYKKNNCRFEGTKAVCEGMVKETMALENGKFITSSVKGEDVYEKRNGVIKILSSEANADEGQIGTRQSPQSPLEMK